MAKNEATRLRIFLSYGHDEHFSDVECIKLYLEGLGHAVWFDRERLVPGCDWETHIEKGFDWLSEGEVDSRFILVMTPHSVRRPDGFCLNELRDALDRRVPIIPVMLAWVKPPLSICRLQYLDLTRSLPLPEGQEDLVKHLDKLGAALSIRDPSFDDTSSLLARHLKPISFDEELAHCSENFVGREWVFEAVDQWLRDAEADRVFWIVGNPGTGKTSLAVKIATTLPEVAAWHICRFDNRLKSDPARCVRSLAFHLATQLPEYANLLGKTKWEELSEKDSSYTLFDELILGPLSRIAAPDRHVIVVIDALDEASHDGRNDLADLIGQYFERTPSWFRLIITSRPEAEIVSPLLALSPLDLGAFANRNAADVEKYLRHELLGSDSFNDEAVSSLVSSCDGQFLYAVTLVREIKRGSYFLNQLQNIPRSLGGIYMQYFRRQFGEIDYYRRCVRPFLALLCIARGPLPMGLAARALHWTKQGRRDLISALGSLVVVRDETVVFFHKAIADWLVDEMTVNQYWIDSEEGHSTFADVAAKIVETLDLPETGEPPGTDMATEYVVEHLGLSLLKLQRFHDLARFLGDPRMIVRRMKVGMGIDYDEMRRLRGSFEELVDRVASAYPHSLDPSPLFECAEVLVKRAWNMIDYSKPGVMSLCGWLDCQNDPEIFLKVMGGLPIVESSLQHGHMLPEIRRLAPKYVNAWTEALQLLISAVKIAHFLARKRNELVPFLPIIIDRRLLNFCHSEGNEVAQELSVSTRAESYRSEALLGSLQNFISEAVNQFRGDPRVRFDLT